MDELYFWNISLFGKKLRQDILFFFIKSFDFKIPDKVLESKRFLILVLLMFIVENVLATFADETGNDNKLKISLF